MTTVLLDRKNAVLAAIERSKDKDGNLIGNEYCNSCGRDMGYSIHTHSEDPVRYKDDSIFRDGVAETCGPCFKEEGILIG